VVEHLPTMSKALGLVHSTTKKESGPDTVAHTCNLSYSGGKNKEDHGSRPTPSKVSEILSQSISWHGDVFLR
jgi:hypothetical protein